MFIDLVEIKLQAGRGGDGLVSFRREKYIDRGGPNGGNGGHGGSIVFQASKDEYDLTQFRFQKLIKAANGQNGQSAKKQGKSAQDVVINVPVGTLIYDLDGDTLVADLDTHGQEVLLAQGGLGGFGNAHFKSSTNRAPLVAEKGLKGEVKHLKCELKLLAEVGLIGLPNSGKSTFLKVTTKANPKIGAYPFTTLEPNLGVTKNNCLLADIPGLIEGAAEGKGLGHQFLRHIERNLVLLHLIDVQNEAPDKAYLQIMTELEKYNPNLVKLPQLVALTKIDLVPPSVLDEQFETLKSVIESGHKIYSISAMANVNLDQLLADLKLVINRQRQKVKIQNLPEEIPVFSLEEGSGFVITKQKNTFLITGSKIETFASKTNFNDFHSRQRLRDIMFKLGISKQLLSLGYKDEQIVFGRTKIGKLYLYEVD